MCRFVLVGIAAIVLMVVTGGGPINAPLARAMPADAAVRVVRFTGSDGAVSVQFARFAGGGRTMSVPAGTAPAAGGYALLSPGAYVLTARSELPVAPLLTVTVRPGAAYTVGVFIGAGQVQAAFLRDDLAAPPAGSGRVRLVLAAAEVPRVSVRLASGPVLAEAAPYGTVTGYHTVRARRWRVTVASARVSSRSAGPRTVGEVEVRPGSLSTLVVADVPSGGLAVRSITDAAGAGLSPGGAVPAGGGGMAAAAHRDARGPSAPVMGVLEVLGAFSLWAVLHALVVARRRRVAARGSAGW